MSLVFKTYRSDY